MSIHADTIIQEVRTELKSYDASGVLPDDLTMYDMIFKCLKRFGNLIMTLNEAVVQVENGKGTLPSNFNNLNLALKMDKSHFCTDMSKDELQTAYFWKERIEKSTDWNTCADCEQRFTEKTIVEKVYLRGKESRFHYSNPVKLKLGKHVNRDAIAGDCLNKAVTNCPHEITINNNTLYANFSSGTVFVRYYGVETDEDGKPYIPETPMERLENYVRYHLKLKLFELMWLNGDDTDIITKIQYLTGQESTAFMEAKADIKAAGLTLKGFAKINRKNKLRSTTFEY